jgi:hypothetical protein
VIRESAHPSGDQGHRASPGWKRPEFSFGILVPLNLKLLIQPFSNGLKWNALPRLHALRDRLPEQAQPPEASAIIDSTAANGPMGHSTKSLCDSPLRGDPAAGASKARWTVQRLPRITVPACHRSPHHHSLSNIGTVSPWRQTLGQRSPVRIAASEVMGRRAPTRTRDLELSVPRCLARNAKRC